MTQETAGLGTGLRVLVSFFEIEADLRPVEQSVLSVL